MKKKSIIKFIVIIICLIIIVFVGNLIRKTYIIAKYEKNNQKYNEITNFYRKCMTDDYAISENWRKGNVSLYKRTSEDGVRMIYRNDDEKIGWIIVDTKTDNNVNKSAVKIGEENFENLILPNASFGGIGTENIWQCLQFAFMSTVTTGEYSGIKCYKIKAFNDWIEYVNKENYLCIRSINGGTDTGLIEYRFNEVTDDDLKLPDFSDFQVTESK